MFHGRLLVTNRCLSDCVVHTTNRMHTSVGEVCLTSADERTNDRTNERVDERCVP